jgi:hypothetical protein
VAIATSFEKQEKLIKSKNSNSYHATSQGGNIPGEDKFVSVCGVNNETSVLREYIRTHQQAIEFLKKDATISRPKFLVWKCQDKKKLGGIGDRLK